MQGGSENAGKLLYNKRLRIDALQNACVPPGPDGFSVGFSGLRPMRGRKWIAAGQNFKIKSQGV